MSLYENINKKKKSGTSKTKKKSTKLMNNSDNFKTKITRKSI